MMIPDLVLNKIYYYLYHNKIVNLKLELERYFFNSCSSKMLSLPNENYIQNIGRFWDCSNEGLDISKLYVHIYYDIKCPYNIKPFRDLRLNISNDIIDKIDNCDIFRKKEIIQSFKLDQLFNLKRLKEYPIPYYIENHYRKVEFHWCIRYTLPIINKIRIRIIWYDISLPIIGIMNPLLN